MNWNFTRHTFQRTFQRILPVLLALSFTLHPTPVTADDPLPEIGEAVSLDTSELPENSLSFTGCGGVVVGAINASYEQRVVELVNQHRAAVGRPPLKRTTELDYAARYHAKDMMDDDYFSHDSQDRVNNTLYMACIWSARVQNFYSNRQYLGENIAAGQQTPESMVDSLMNSPGHRDNILNENYQEIGVAYMQLGGRYGRYWVQDFGSRSNVYPVIINQEAATTASPQVNLYVYGKNVWNEMRLRNDNEVWSTWRPFQESLNWSLPGSAGAHSVSVELRNADGLTAAASSDSITILNLPYDIFLPTTIRR